MAEILLVLIAWLFSMASCVAVVLWDRSRLPALQRERAWNSASFASAIFVFAPLCIIAHFWVTRRSLRGILLGLAWLVALLVVQTLFNSALGLLLGL